MTLDVVRTNDLIQLREPIVLILGPICPIYADLLTGTLGLGTERYATPGR